MEKRQIIILGAAAIAILYFVYAFLFASPAKKTASSPAKNASEFKALATDLSISASKDVLSPVEAYAISRAETEWLRDPFYDKKAYSDMFNAKESSKAGADTQRITFNYTGYVEYSGKSMAIINGVEYSAGEALEKPGYVLRSISPGKVIIENKADSERIEIPITD